MTNIFEAIVAESQSRPATCGSVRVIAVDGPAGAGKTTLAHFLSTQLGNCPVISMDSLYNGWDDAITEATIHRVIEQILQPLERDMPTSYQTYDWHAEQFAGRCEIEPATFVILEGVGSSHPMLRPYLTLTIWVEAQEKLLLKRVLKRDGEQIREQMLKWQKMERNYFRATNAKEFADFVINAQ